MCVCVALALALHCRAEEEEEEGPPTDEELLAQLLSEEPYICEDQFINPEGLFMLVSDFHLRESEPFKAHTLFYAEDTTDQLAEDFALVCLLGTFCCIRLCDGASLYSKRICRYICKITRCTRVMLGIQQAGEFWTRPLWFVWNALRR